MSACAMHRTMELASSLLFFKRLLMFFLFAIAQKVSINIYGTCPK
jgi:hypothetical protein